jgi:hypothetical protein
MSGRPGRSGGWNRLTPTQHTLRGTSPRHGPAPVLTATAIPRSDPIPPDVIEQLTGRGLAFVTALWHGYAPWTPQALQVLRELGFLVNQLETLRGTSAERAAQRLLVTLIASLRLEE